MKSIQFSILLLPLIGFVGCSNPADSVPGANVSAATNAPAAITVSDESETRYYVFGPETSTIEFVGSKVTGKHDGGFKHFVGELAVADGKLAGAGNKVVIDMNSIWSDNERLTGHLKNADFFDVAQFPTSTFESTAVEQKPGESTVTGNLTMHGVTKQISFPAKIEISESAVNVSAEFFINRFDFDMKYPGKADDLIRKEVVLKLNIKASPGRATWSTEPKQVAQKRR